MKTWKILVAEDNTVNQLIVREMLQRLGYDFVLVENGKLAMLALQQQNFDLILMDCYMPEVDGFTATEMIRKELKNKDLPIIAMTALETPAEEAKCREVGMTDYLPKPLSLPSVESLLNKHLRPQQEL